MPNPKARANAAVRAEVSRWSMSDQVEDPGEILLRLVSQSSARVQKYSLLLEQAYEAAERLAASSEAGKMLDELDVEAKSYTDDDGREVWESAAVQKAKADLDRIFSLGGVAALVGGTYSASNSGMLYQTGEAIRGLAKLEAEERDRCASFATKAIAAGLAERSVRLAERMGQQLADVLRAVLSDAALGLTAEQRKAAPDTIRRHLALVAS